MKTIALALIGAISMAAAPQVKAEAVAFKVKAVTVVSVNGKRPANDPQYKKASFIDLTITSKQFKAPKGISIPAFSKSATSDGYFESTGVLSTATATVHKSPKTKKVTSVDLTFVGPVVIFGTTTAPAQISYTLVPK
ncbi:MAG: hypothetical protein ABIS50_19490 [Luteolibacter sp.]|uniref:hypothetical protein n=1 Tax=Luteolibacter sp. TaxID=1962973 RepID=UPI0032663ECE